ncbi:MAG: hypothetical protein FJ104_02995 [Deltaproteobacteria bacterium]|nr:hypothetical protein [Deltaproteobacteria bacterium]
MRAYSLAFALLAVSCKTSNVEGGELSRKQCQDLVRHVQRLESADTGGMKDSLHAARRASVEGCLRRGTERAHRCILRAESVGDLEACDMLQ